jgi:hypothetical protein
VTTIALATSFDGHDFGGQLLDARADEAHEILRSLTAEHAIVITGEHDVGKTRLVEKALAPLALSEGWRAARVDLRRATSDTRLAWEWLRAIAHAVAGPVAFSHIAAMGPSMWPGTTRSAALEVRRLLGSHNDWALAERPERLTKAAAREALEAAREATIACAAEQRTVLVLDHAEAPSDSPRKAVDVEEVLWTLRPTTGTRERLHLAILCHPTALAGIAGADGPLLGSRQIVVNRPSRAVWLDALRDRPFPERLLSEAVGLTRAHIPSTVLLLWTLSRSPNATVGAAFDALARTQFEHAQRCLRHAATLHRLGAQLLEVVARGERPYQATPDTRSTRDIGKALNALWRVGLVVHPEEGRWEIADPFVARLLGSE